MIMTVSNKNENNNYKKKDDKNSNRCNNFLKNFRKFLNNFQF